MRFRFARALVVGAMTAFAIHLVACSLVNAPDDVVPAGKASAGGGSSATTGADCSGDGDCDDADPCNGTETCEGGKCIRTQPPIDDHNACTTDSCTAETGVVHEAMAVDDGDACTTDDCDKDTGSVTHTPVQLDDDNACTTDACDPEVGPSHVPIAEVDDGNSCTFDACDKATGGVTHTKLAGCSCAHSLCDTSGVALDEAACSWGTVDCIEKVCAIQPSCCDDNGTWDAACVTLVKDGATCGFTCPGFGCNYCASSPTPLNAMCDPCVKRICDLKPECCTTAWDAACVALTNTACNVPSAPNCN